MNGGRIYYSLYNYLNSDIIKVVQRYLLPPPADRNKNNLLDLFRRINILYFINGIIKIKKYNLSLLEKLEFCNEEYDNCNCDLNFYDLEENIKNIIKYEYHNVFHKRYTNNSFLRIINSMPNWVFEYENKNDIYDYYNDGEDTMFYKRD